MGAPFLFLPITDAVALEDAVQIGDVLLLVDSKAETYPLSYPAITANVFADPTFRHIVTQQTHKVLIHRELGWAVGGMAFGREEPQPL